MKKLMYLLSISLIGAAGITRQASAADTAENVWTAAEFWKEGVEPRLNELRQQILSRESNFSWHLFKVFLKQHFVQHQEYPHSDQALRCLLDRWYELYRAELSL